MHRPNAWQNVRFCKASQAAWQARLACALLLCALAAIAHAASVYRCSSANGRLAFQDIPCAAHSQQHKINVTPQPLIGAPGEAAARRRSLRSHHAASRPRRHATRRHQPKPVMSWECNAADGEVFYRHTRCPGSVPGDGVVRSGYAQEQSGSHSRRRHNAWGSVRVHGVKVTRAEACKNIHSAGAAVRDGHLRDANVSTYDHLMGRDPCSGY